jgi:hypothetical protein
MLKGRIFVKRDGVSFRLQTDLALSGPTALSYRLCGIHHVVRRVTDGNQVHKRLEVLGSLPDREERRKV